MATYDEVPDDEWCRIFWLLRSYLARARCLAVCRQWCRAGREAGPQLLPSLVFPSTEAGRTTAFDLVVRRPLRLRNAPSFTGTRVIGSFSGGRIAVVYEVPKTTRYGIVDIWNREDPRPIPDSVRLPGVADALPVDIQLITGGTDVFAAIVDGPPRLAFWRVGMEAWCPPRPQGQGGWEALVPGFAIQDVLYHETDDTFYVISVLGDLWTYTPVRQQGGGITFERSLSVWGLDLMGALAVRYISVAGPGDLLVVLRTPTTVRLFRLLRQATGRWSSFRLREPRSVIMFVGRGCSRAYPATAGTPAYLYFMDGFCSRYVSDADQSIQSVISVLPELPPFWMLPPGGDIME